MLVCRLALSKIVTTMDKKVTKVFQPCFEPSFWTLCTRKKLMDSRPHYEEHKEIIDSICEVCAGKLFGCL